MGMWGQCSRRKLNLKFWQVMRVRSVENGKKGAEREIMRCCNAAVVKEKGVRGGRQNITVQNPNDKW
jgi:hypothetical protein